MSTKSKSKSSKYLLKSDFKSLDHTNLSKGQSVDLRQQLLVPRAVEQGRAKAIMIIYNGLLSIYR